MNHDPKKSSVTRVLVSGGLWGNLSTVTPVAGSIVLTPYFIHGFGVKRWGLFVLLSAVSTAFGPLGGGIGPAVGRFFSIHAATGDKRNLTMTLITSSAAVLALGALVTAVLWFVADPLIGLFGASHQLRGEGVFFLRGAGLLFAVVLLQNIFGALFSAHQAYALINLMSVVSYGVWALLMIMSFKEGYGLRGAVVALIAQQASSLVILVPASIPFLSRGAAPLSWPDTKVFLKFAASTQGMSLVGLVNEELDSLLIGGFFNLTSLTYFNSGANFAMQIRGVAYNFLTPPGVYLARSFGTGGESAALRDFERLQRVWVVAVVGLSTVALAAAYFAMPAWLGRRFVLAGEVACVFMVGNAVNLCTGMLTQYLAAIGRPDLEVRYGVFSTVVNLALTAPALFIGPVYVAAATALGSGMASFYLLRVVRIGGLRRKPDRPTLLKVPSFLGDVPVIPAAVAGLLTVALELAVRPLDVTGPLGLILCGVPALFGLLLYGGLVFRTHLLSILRMARTRNFDMKALLAAIVD